MERNLAQCTLALHLNVAQLHFKLAQICHLWLPQWQRVTEREVHTDRSARERTLEGWPSSLDEYPYSLCIVFHCLPEPRVTLDISY